MGLMKKEKIFSFVRELAYGLEEIDGVDISEAVIRYEKYEGNLDNFVYEESPESCFVDADESIEEFTGDKYADIYLSCEGDIYEMYAWGKDERAKEVKNVIDSLSDKYDVLPELCDGAIAFYSRESWELMEKEI